MATTADKTVTVRLEAEDHITSVLKSAAAQAGVLTSAAEKAQTATNRIGSGPGLGKATNDFRQSGRAADALSGSMSKAAAATTSLERAAQQSGAATKRTGDALSRVAGSTRDVAAASGQAARAGQQMTAAQNAAGKSATVLARRQKEAERASHGLAAAIGGALGGFAGGLVGGAALAGLERLKDGLIGTKDAARDLAEAQQKSQVVFGQNAGQMQAWASQSATAFDLSTRAATEASASFGDMFTQLGFTGQQAVNMSQDVVALASDLGAMNNVGTGDVLERISAGFRGEYDSLQLLIPNISAARVEQEAMATTGAKSASSLTAQQKAAAVLSIIHKDGAKSAGFFKDNLNSAAEQEQVAAANAENLAAAVGQALIPAWTTLLTAMNNVMPALTSAAGGLSGITSAAGSAVQAVLGLPAPVQAAAAGMLAFRAGREPLEALASTVRGKATSAFQDFRTAVSFAGEASARARQQAVDAGAAAGGMGARWAGAAAGVRTFTGVAGGGAGAMSALKGAAGGLLGVLGGGWGIAFAGASAAIGYFVQKHQEAVQHEEELRQASQNLAQQIAAEGGAWTTQASQHLVAMAQQKNLMQNYHNMGYSVEEVTTALTQQGPVRDRILGQVDAHIERVRQENTIMTENGPMLTSRGQELVDYYSQQAAGMREVAGVGSAAAEQAKTLAAMNAVVAEKSRDAAGASEGLAGANRESAEAAKAADDALSGLANTVTRGRNAQSDYYAAVEETSRKIRGLSGATTKNGADFDLTTEKGRNAQTQLLKLGNAARDAALAQVDLSGDTGKASAQMGKARDSFIAAAVKMGLNKQAAAQLATQLGLTTQAVNNHAAAIGKVPNSKSTTFTTPGLSDAVANVTALGRKISQIQDKNVTITYYEKAVKVGGREGRADIGYADGAVVEAFANGGMRERHIAQIARPGAWRVWAEDETGGEAYIPLARSKRARSVAILEEVARRFGMAVTAQARGSILSFAGGGTTVPARGGSRQTVDGLMSSGWTIPVTAKVTKVTIPAGVQAPFLYTPGGKWDRGGTIPEVALSKITDQFKKNYVSPAQLAEAAKKLADARGTVNVKTSSASPVRMAGALAAAPTALRGLISSAAAKYGLSANLVAAVVKAESGFNAKARSRAGAQGLMQLMPGTARALGVKNPLDAKQNLEGGVKYLSQLLKQFKGDTGKALAAYNAGPGRAMSKRPLPRETTRYVSQILGDAGVRGGSARASVSGARAAGKAAGSAVAATNAAYVSAMRGQVAAKTSPDNARAAALANALSMNGRGSYRYGGGHSAGYYKNSAALAADCSGFVGWAIGHAVGKNATGVTTTMLTNNKSLGYVKIDPKIAAKTAGAIMGNAGHVVMSLGDGRVIESYQTGKPVRIRKLASRDMKMAAWNTALGPMTQATAAQITGGQAGTAVGGSAPSASDLKNLAEAQAEYARALKQSKIPARTLFAQATVNATKMTSQFLGNIRKIRDRGFPEVAARILMMGEEDGAAVAASFASGDAKTLRNEQANLKNNAAYESMRKDLEASLSAYKGPPAWITAVQDNNRTNTKTKQFLADVKKLQAMGYTTLADKLIDMGVDDGYDLARQAVGLNAKGIRNLRDTLADQPRDLQRQQDAMAKRATITMGTASTAKFIADIKKIRDAGYPTLALKLMEMGEAEGGAMASEAAKASTTDMAKLQADLTASEAIGKQAQSLLDQLRGVGQVLNVSVGQSTGSDPAIRYTAPRAVDARPAPVQYLVGPQGGTTGASAPLVHVEHMHAANPADAASAMETRLGDAVAVAGVGRVI